MELKDAMTIEAVHYANALQELRRFGPAVFIQPGGMCAALELTLERGYLLITDAEDPLPWSRTELLGWGVRFYPSQDAGEGPEVSLDTSDTSVLGLRGAIEQCLREVASVRVLPCGRSSAS